MSITSFIWDNELKSYFVTGYGSNSKNNGTIWESHDDNWIGRVSIENSLLSEWTYKRKSIDKINDFVILNNHIITTGESWDRRLEEIIKEMRMIKIEKSK